MRQQSDLLIIEKTSTASDLISPHTIEVSPDSKGHEDSGSILTMEI
jgi:hypothetical protein